ncbi:sugar ABC transporter permease [Luteimicrobium album]|uniref:Sugar ABC transporter permease n=1 Tax=Luteimicrobium album TaxID=1054550 RepID=A0ABQ6I144_9MICO|nr:sugar ABC transporter permease [Luteimicrobium album]GMA23669.1 sugar ABC transporter permease [Luteimicrobium album]
MAFLAPTVLVFAAFSWWPIVGAVRLSFQKTNLVTPAHWVGTDNFRRVLDDPLFGTAVRNTAVFTALDLLIWFPVAVLLAVVISELTRAGALYRTLVYLPVVIPPVVGVLLWKTFYDSDYGLFNDILGLVGLGPYPWLQDSTWALPSLVLQHVWASLGGAVLIFIAALANVQRELYEAAEIDGAKVRHRFWHITLPQMRGVLLVMFLLQAIGLFQIFTEPFVMTNGGPADSTITILQLIYRYGFEYGQYGTAAAASVMLAVVLCLLSAVYLWATRKWGSR